MPQVLGGSKTVPLCAECHGRVHGIALQNRGLLTREGLRKARAQGKKLGQRPMSEIAPDIVKLVKSLYATGNYTHRSLADELNRRGVPTATGRGKWWPRNVEIAIKS